MLTDIYFEALLVVEVLAGQVWDTAEVDDMTAWAACWFVATTGAVERPAPRKLA